MQGFIVSAGRAEISTQGEGIVDAGLINEVVESPEATLNKQMKLALEKIAFLPFGKMIDEWRWKVFSGEVTPDN